MSRYIYLRLAIPVLIAAIALPLTAHGQSQDSQTESIADAARRAREQKKAAAKPSHVVTDDNLKPASIAAPEANSPATAPGQSSEAAPKPTSESEPRPPADSSNAPAPDQSTAAPAPPPATPEDAQKKANDTAELTALKQQLAEAQKGLDLVQREFALQQDTYYSNPDHDKDIAGKAKLDDMKQQILDKQQVVEGLKTRVSALLESAGNTAPVPATGPPPPPQF